jgi:hypothetical protein
MRYVVIPITELTPAPDGARCNVKGTAYIADTDVESEYTMTHEEALMFVDYDTTGFKSIEIDEPTE